MRRALTLFFAIAATGCAQPIYGPHGRADGGSGDGSLPTSEDGGPDTGAVAGAGDDGGPGDAWVFTGGDGGPGPTLTCTRTTSGPVIAGEPVEIDCTAGGAPRPLVFRQESSPAFAIYDDQLAARGKLWV